VFFFKLNKLNSFELVLIGLLVFIFELVVDDDESFIKEPIKPVYLNKELFLFVCVVYLLQFEACFDKFCLTILAYKIILIL
jgi:hypothetical protein